MTEIMPLIERADAAMKAARANNTPAIHISLANELVAALTTSLAETRRLHSELNQALNQRDIARRQRDDARTRNTGMTP